MAQLFFLVNFYGLYWHLVLQRDRENVQSPEPVLWMDGENVHSLSYGWTGKMFTLIIQIPHRK